jgi:hypothetical protein
MGYSSYSTSSRNLRSETLYSSAVSTDAIFTQQKEKKAHESMLSQNLTKRECRDSETHPNTIPIILALDVTGSMGMIPDQLIREGLPKMMGNMIQKGATDASVCFIAIGDHACDDYPLQVGQFESGDEELDMWLTRTYLEGRGGGNNGESYMLAWLFGARHTEIDSYNKRNKKGFLFTVGDEPCLKSLPAYAIKEITSVNEKETLTSDELLAEAQKMYNVYHLHIIHSSQSESSLGEWKQRLGDNNCIEVNDYKMVADIISDIVIKNSTMSAVEPSSPSSSLKSNIEEIL